MKNRRAGTPKQDKSFAFIQEVTTQLAHIKEEQADFFIKAQGSCQF